MTSATKYVGIMEQYDSSKIKRMLKASNWSGDFVGVGGSLIRFNTTDIDFLQEYEADTYIIDRDDYSLDKPLCVIYVDKASPEISTVNGCLVRDIIKVDHQMIVNYELGKLNLDGYLSLLEEVYKQDRGGDFIDLYGLKSLTMERGPLVDGGELYDSLQGRLLIQMLSVYLQVL